MMLDDITAGDTPLTPASAATVYVAGPMSNLPDFNYPAFHALASGLRAMGFTVLNPAEVDGGTADKHWTFYMRAAIGLVARADAVVVLPGWSLSKGARLEVDIALKLGMRVVRAEDLREI